MLNKITFAIALFFSTSVLLASSGKKQHKTNMQKLEKVARKYSKSHNKHLKEKFVKTYKTLFIQDSLRLSELLQEGTKKSWYAYQSTLNRMKERQLFAEKAGVKCDNYDYDYSLLSAKRYFAKVNVQKGKTDLQNAKLTQNRKLAEKAYQELIFAYMLGSNELLMPVIKEARKTSKTHILITINNKSNATIPNEVKQGILSRFQTGEFKNMVVATKVEPNVYYDFIVSVTLDSIYVENYWSGYFGANLNYDLYEKGFSDYTAPHNFRLSRVMNRGIAAKTVRNNIALINLYKFLTPYEQAIVSYNKQFKSHVPLFRVFNIKGKYELINVRAQQVIAEESLNFYRKISPSTLIPLKPGQNKEYEMLKFSLGFYQTDLPEAFFTNTLFKKHINATIQYELGKFLVDNEHVFLGEYVFANK